MSSVVSYWAAPSDVVIGANPLKFSDVLLSDINFQMIILRGVAKQILCHNSVEFIEYLRQAYKVFQKLLELLKPLIH